MATYTPDFTPDDGRDDLAACFEVDEEVVARIQVETRARKDLAVRAWGNMFRLLGWPTTQPARGLAYDLVLDFPHAPVGVVVTADESPRALEASTQRLDPRGHWRGEILAVGACGPILAEHGYDSLGWVTQYALYDEGWWQPANLHRCAACGQESIHHEGGGWYCYLCGAHDGDHYLGDSRHDAHKLWQQAVRLAGKQISGVAR